VFEGFRNDFSTFTLARFDGLAACSVH
jgi:hypothetical protein